MEEEWKKIPGFSGYSVSNLGRVRNDDTERILRVYPNAEGTMMVGMRDQGLTYTRSIKRLVALAFVSNLLDLEADTPLLLDGDQTNCAAGNIVWRPRWFVHKYAQNFKHASALVAMPIVDNNGVEYQSVLSCAKLYGLLCVDIRRSLITQEIVYPVWLSFGLQ